MKKALLCISDVVCLMLYISDAVHLMLCVSPFRYSLVDFGLAQQVPVPRKQTAPCATPMSRSHAKTGTIIRNEAETSNFSSCTVKVADHIKVKNTFAVLSPKSKSRRCKMADIQVQWHTTLMICYPIVISSLLSNGVKTRFLIGSGNQKVTILFIKKSYLKHRRFC